MSNNNLSTFIWSVADLLRGDYKQSDYGKVILAFTILRRLDCALDATKEQTLIEHEKSVNQGLDSDQYLPPITGYSFFNTSKLDLGKLLADPNKIRQNLISYLAGFSPNVGDIFIKFD